MKRSVLFSPHGSPVRFYLSSTNDEGDTEARKSAAGLCGPTVWIWVLTQMCSCDIRALPCSHLSVGSGPYWKTFPSQEMNRRHLQAPCTGITESRQTQGEWQSAQEGQAWEQTATEWPSKVTSTGTSGLTGRKEGAQDRAMSLPAPPSVPSPPTAALQKGIREDRQS